MCSLAGSGLMNIYWKRRRRRRKQGRKEKAKRRARKQLYIQTPDRPPLAAATGTNKKQKLYLRYLGLGTCGDLEGEVHT